MNSYLHYETVTPLLKKILNDIMASPVFEPFCLVGGTSLSLRLGHRISVDIDLFTNAAYGSLEFSEFEQFFQISYPYYNRASKTNLIGLGRSYYVGRSIEDNIKIDLYYHEEISKPYELIDGIRMASMDNIVAMKVDVIARGGRKKDFWDLHELTEVYSISQMLNLHKQYYEYTHDRKLIMDNFTDFTSADDNIDPICLKGKVWELIKLDFIEMIEKLNNGN